MTDQPEWAVVKSNYPPYDAVGPISKQTAQRIYIPSKYRPGKELFHYLDAVAFRGSEAECKALAERLVSSKALADQERQDAWKRHERRVQDILAKAAPQ